MLQLLLVWLFGDIGKPSDYTKKILTHTGISNYPLPHDCIVWFRNRNNNLMLVNKNNNFYYI